MSSDSDEYEDAVESEKDSDFSEADEIPGIVDEEDNHDNSSFTKTATTNQNAAVNGWPEPDDLRPPNLKPDELEKRKEDESQLSVDELEGRKTTAMELKDSGNLLFKTSSYEEALSKYTKALDVCPLIYQVERSVMFANRAACFAKLDKVEAALLDCDASLELQPDYVKCLLRRATLREQKDRLTDALEDYKKLLELDPKNEQARYACMTLPERIKIQQEKMKEEMLGQLKQLGNMILKPFGLSTDNFKVQQDPSTGQYSINFGR